VRWSYLTAKVFKTTVSAPLRVELVGKLNSLLISGIARPANIMLLPQSLKPWKTGARHRPSDGFLSHL